MSYTGGMAKSFVLHHSRAVDDALRAGAEEYIEGLKDPKPLGLRGGYTSGAFSKDRQIDSLKVADPFTDKAQRGRSIFVYTDVPWAFAWEEGHQNIFTRRREHQDRWHSTAVRKSEDILAAQARAYRRVFG
jgi:hypothetical protein